MCEIVEQSKIRTRDERNVNLDVIRCLAMFMVIMVHTIGNLAGFAQPYNKMWYVVEITNSIVFACNGLFFMLSGYLSLDKNKESIKEFYLHKIIKIIVPFFIISFLYYVRSLYFANDLSVISIMKNIPDFIMQFLTGNISSHFWFMYYLIGAYIMCPFLGKMVENLSDHELKIFTGISFGLQIFITTISFTKWSFYYQAFLTIGLINWMFYFLLGYTVKRLIKPKMISWKWLIGGMICSLVVVLLEKRFLCSNPYIDNQSPTMMIMTISIFLFVRDYVHISSMRFGKIITYIAKHSFVVYMMHIIVLARIIPIFINKMNSGWGIIGYGLAGYVMICVVTIGISIILNALFFNPIIKFIFHLTDKNKK